MNDIKLFRKTGKAVTEIIGGAMDLEKPLQSLFEYNLEALLGVHFLASEYLITEGRIDTLGLDENYCPVIIEYKCQSNQNIINQGLFYLDWLMDHQANFTLLVLDELGKLDADNIDWSAPRLVCVAGDFTRFDAHAVKQMNRNIELIRYRKFGEDLLMLDLLTAATSSTSKGNNAISHRGSSQKNHDEFIASAAGPQKARFESLRTYINDLGDDVQEHRLKRYIAFKRIKNFSCVELRNTKGSIMVFLQLEKKSLKLEKGFIRDVSKIGHYGTGNIEITISSDEHLERAKPLIKKSYESS